MLIICTHVVCDRRNAKVTRVSALICETLTRDLSLFRPISCTISSTYVVASLGPSFLATTKTQVS